MKAAFIHDHYFVHDKVNNKYYDGSGGVFNYRLWQRYLSIFQSLIVVGREKSTLPNRLVDSMYEGVSFELRPELKTKIDRFTKKEILKYELQKTLQKVDFAIIRLPSVLGTIAQDICEDLNVPYILEVVTCPWDAYWNYGSVLGKLVAPFEYVKLRNSTKRAKNVIYVTQSFLQERYPTFNRQIGISNVLIKDRKCIDDILQFYSNKTPEIFKIGLIGSFHVRWKGHTEALKAIAELINSGVKNIKLYLVGTGDYTWISDIIFNEKLNDYVEIIGTLESGNNGIFPFLDDIHLYIHPSKQEGLPRVVIEALSRGRLVLGSSIAGTPELLDKRYLHSPGDWKTLSEQIKDIYNNSEEWINISKLNWEKSSEYLESILHKKRLKFILGSLKLK